MQLPYFYQPLAAAINTTIILSEDASKHCVQVLRMKEGDKLQLTNGKGGLFTAAITNSDKKHCSVIVEEATFQPQAARTICIAISLLKNATRWEWFLEKAVEMGVQQIIPLLCDRTEKQRYKEERLHNIVVSAMLQSRQLWLPQLHQPTPFTELMNRHSSFTQKLIAHCRDDDTKTPLQMVQNGTNTQTLIGPEGDFTEKEIALALQNNYQPVSLGTTRLRTETAGVVASALLIYTSK
ncbi:MAG: 16S rRNA (uracil(1498)-N(3))-methyltransferase [Bacteroidota bacterium]|nr:16S rRNA (uracil(1498)-N(3))-methyltransferase [Bacteroidota bacterium]